MQTLLRHLCEGLPTAEFSTSYRSLSLIRTGAPLSSSRLAHTACTSDAGAGDLFEVDWESKSFFLIKEKPRSESDGGSLSIGSEATAESDDDSHYWCSEQIKEA